MMNVVNGDNWNYKTRKAPVTNQCFLQPGYPSCRPTNSVRALKWKLLGMIW